MSTRSTEENREKVEGLESGEDQPLPVDAPAETFDCRQDFAQ